MSYSVYRVVQGGSGCIPVANTEAEKNFEYYLPNKIDPMGRIKEFNHYLPLSLVPLMLTGLNSFFGFI